MCKRREVLVLLYLRLGKLTDDEVGGKDEEPGNDAVDELEAGVMYSRCWTKLRLHQTLFDDRDECDAETEQ